jgi:hypothetical protein
MAKAGLAWPRASTPVTGPCSCAATPAPSGQPAATHERGEKRGHGHQRRDGRHRERRRASSPTCVEVRREREVSNAQAYEGPISGTQERGLGSLREENIRRQPTNRRGKAHVLALYDSDARVTHRRHRGSGVVSSHALLGPDFDTCKPQMVWPSASSIACQTESSLSRELGRSEYETCTACIGLYYHSVVVTKT